MRIAVYAFSRRGRETALRARQALDDGKSEIVLRAPEKLAGDGFEGYAGSLSACAGGDFDRDAMIFVGACGIAVRAVAPHVKSKVCDPAVLCVDERGQFVIALLSGHIGGANRLAARLAEALGATPVITTATDVNGRFSVDDWAARHNLHIDSMALAKRVSAEILDRDIPIFCERPVQGHLPEGLYTGDSGPLGICVAVRRMRPFDQTLMLTPRVLQVGVGCRRGATADQIAAAVDRAFELAGLRSQGVCGVASIDVKADERGLLDFCASRGWPVSFYSAQALNEVPGNFHASEFVRRTVSVDNVCERAALAGGGALVAPKMALDGVTVAVAEQDWRIEFGKDSSSGHRAR